MDLKVNMDDLKIRIQVRIGGNEEIQEVENLETSAIDVTWTKIKANLKDDLDVTPVPNVVLAVQGSKQVVLEIYAAEASSIEDVNVA